MAEGTVRIDGTTLHLPGGVRVRFIRTLRLPEQGTHQLPPGLGDFPIRRVEDYPHTTSAEMRARGGVMLPVYLREAMWLHFGGSTEPAALQVGVGKVCAVSGKPWTGALAREPQNYVVLPRQPWLDGINSGKGTVRQFVAVPLGLGATVEGQVTGEEVFGGVQLQSFPLNEKQLAVWREEEQLRAEAERGLGGLATTTLYGGGTGPVPMPPPGAVPMPPPSTGAPLPPAPGGAPMPAAPGGGPAGAYPTAAPMAAYGAAPARSAPAAPSRAPAAMGLGVGGSMRQEVYRDTWPRGSWARRPAGRVFVHLVTPPEWRRITGEAPPPSPVDRAAYTRAGLPWFEYYDNDAHDLDPADTLGAVKPVGDWLGDDLDPWQAPAPGQVKPLGDAPGKPVQDGDW
ncbi:GyrI-like domain-containing protein [Streptomyces sp. NPDC051773]|uniref:GyrI-like domain-containing protein n=1 Tax=Streptomyces sp. NPDC051773 TaxID=3156682 RepID=UPI00341DCB26